MKPIIGIPCAFQAPQDERGLGSSALPQSYLRALEMAGGVPMPIPITRKQGTLQALFARMDGLLLAGGVDIDPAHYNEPPHPALGEIDAGRDWVELIVTPWALADGMPVLGICRGIQTLNVAAGGSLWQDIAAQVPDALRHPSYPGSPYSRLSHAVRLEPGSRLAQILGDLELEVNSLHHQAAKAVGEGLRVAARSPDGTIEGLEGQGEAWVVGVQWHPEWLIDDDPRMRQLFEAFVVACEEYRNGQEG
jgi:putative glutamine amidotransferase